MNGTTKLFLIVFIASTLLFEVLLVIRNKTSVQEKQKGEEQEQSIIKTHYVVRNERMLSIITAIAIVSFTSLTILLRMLFLEKAEAWYICAFVVPCLLGMGCTLNMLIWKLEVSGEEIAWRSSLGIVRRFRFDDITGCEKKENSVRVYVNNKKLFHINGNIDCKEFMEDVKRHGIRETDAPARHQERGKKTIRR